jgi:hypothetical protein
MDGEYSSATEFDLRCQLAAWRLETAALRNAATAKGSELLTAQTVALNPEKRLDA